MRHTVEKGPHVHEKSCELMDDMGLVPGECGCEKSYTV